MAKTTKTAKGKAKKSVGKSKNKAVKKVATKKAVAKKGTKTKAKTSKVKAKSVSKSKSKVKSKKAVVKAVAKSKVKAKTKVKVKAKTKAKVKAKPKSIVKAKAKSKAKAKVKSAVKKVVAKKKNSPKKATVKTKVTKATTKKAAVSKKPTAKATPSKGTTKKVAKPKVSSAKKTVKSSVSKGVTAQKTVSKSQNTIIKQPANKESRVAMQIMDEVAVKPKRVAQPRKAIELVQGDDVRAMTHVIAGELEIAPYQPSIDEEYMSDGQKEHFRAILNAVKQQLMEDVDRTVTNMRDDDKNLSDFTDRATKEEEINFMLRTRNREGKLLKKIEDAMDRLNHNEFGFCESCGVEIGIRRLEARPSATLCIDCKTLDEIKEKQRSV